MNRTEILALVKSTILEVIPELTPDSLTPEQSLVDLGANSVDRMDIITLSMESLELNISMLEFAGARNIGDIVAVFAAHVPDSL